LDYERSGIERLMSNYPILGAITRYVQETGQIRRELVRHRLAQLHIEFTMGRFLVYKVAWLLTQGVIPNAESAAAKAYCTEFEQRLAQAASDLMGGYGQLLPGSHPARFHRRIPLPYPSPPPY